MLKRILASALLAFAATVPAFAQVTNPAKVSGVWFSLGRLTSPITATTSSAAALLPSPGFVALVCNTGSNDAYVSFGTANTVTADSGDSYVKAQTCTAFDRKPQTVVFTYMAAISSTGTTTLTVETGSGEPPNPYSGGGGGGGGGGTVTQGPAGTAPWFVGGQYNATPPTLSDGAYNGLQLDANSNLKVNVVTGGGGGSPFGSAFPATGVAAGLNNGTNMVGWPGDATNGAYVQAKSGTFVDGSIATLGTEADAAYAGSGSTTAIGALKGIYASINNPISAGSAIIGKVGIDQTTPGTTNNVAVSYGSSALVDNPCQTAVKTAIPVSISSATTTQIVTPASASGKKVYFCSASLQAAGGANNVGIVEGTGATCGTSTAGIYGGTTASAGLNLTANQGIAWGNGHDYFMKTATTGDGVCLITSASTQLSGHIEVAIK